MTVKTIPIGYSVFREGESPIFGESATHVLVEDEAAGPFIVLKQSHELKEMRFDLDELLAIADIAKRLIQEHQALEGDK